MRQKNNHLDFGLICNLCSFPLTSHIGPYAVIPVTTVK